MMKLTGLLTTNGINRLIQVLADRETVMDNVGLWQMLFGSNGEGFSHIHRDRFDRLALRLFEALQQFFCRFSGSVLNHLKHPTAFKIIQYRHIPMACAEALLINPKMINGMVAPTAQTSRYRSLHDLMSGMPAQSQQSSSGLNA